MLSERVNAHLLVPCHRPNPLWWPFRAMRCIALVLLFFAPAVAHTQPATLTARPDFSQIEGLIKQRIANDRIPSISVAVALGGKIIWERGYGWADRERHAEANERSMYSLASVTKLFTATAIMVLRERGQLDLNRPVNDYLGPAKLTSPVWGPSEATVRRVATHTSGLATYDNGYACRGDEADCQDIMIRRFGVLIWRPGERFDYSNLGYGVLGDVIRHVSRMKYGQFLRSEVFSPLMIDCSLGVAPALERLAAQRYNGADGSPADWSPNDPSSQEAASSVFCSAHDLVRFGMFHLKEDIGTQNVVLSNSAIDEMQNSAVPADDGHRYGFGWWHEERYGYKVAYVSGGYEYASALLFTVPSEKIVVVVLVNTGDGSVAQEVADEVVSLLLPTYGQNRAKATHVDDKPPVNQPSILPSIAGKWSGSLRTELREIPLTLTFDRSSSVQATIASEPAKVQEGAIYRNGQLQCKISGASGVYERDPKKALDLDLLLYLRPGGLLSGGATTVPLSQPEWGVVTYFVQLRPGQGK